MKRLGLILGIAFLGVTALLLSRRWREKPLPVVYPSWPGLENVHRDQLRASGDSAVPGLVAVMKYYSFTESSGWSNVLTGLPATLSQWIPERQNYPFLRYSAVWALGEMGPVASNAVPELDNLRQSSVEEDVRIHAIIALAKIQPDDPVARANLFSLLRSKKQKPRFFAVRELGAIPHPDPELVAALVGALDDPDGGVRANAAWSMAQWGPAGRPAVPRLRELLHDSYRHVSVTAAYALLRAAPEHSTEAVEAMSEFLLRRAPFVELVATPFALELGPLATNAIPWLEKCLVLHGTGVSDEVAMVSLWRIQRQATPAMLERLPKLSSPAAIRALGELGSLALAAEPVLEDMKARGSPPQREAAAEALRRIRAGTPGQ